MTNKKMRAVCLMSIILLATIFTGCATMRVSAPDSALSWQNQMTIASGLEDSFTSLPEIIRGKKIRLDISCLGNAGEERAIRDWAEMLISEKAADLKAEIVNEHWIYRMRVSVEAAGSSMVMRKWSYKNIPVIYSELCRGTTTVNYSLYDAKGRIILSEEKTKTIKLRESFLARILGPFTTKW